MIPKEVTLEAYERVLRDDEIIKGYANTIFYTVLGTVLSLILTFTAAYPLSRKDMVGKKFLTLLYTIELIESDDVIVTSLDPGGSEIEDIGPF